MSPAAGSAHTLESWAATLSFLSADTSRGIEAMARRIDLAMAESAPATSGSLEPNGYGGLTRRGEISRLLLSDWALADSEPDEFLRRLAAAELSYLEVSYEEPRPPSQIAVLLDAGPDQVGAPRLAQLAALVVLDRRARSQHVPIRIGVLGDASRTWRTGELPELFTIWLRARSATRALQADIDSWFDTLAPSSSTWLFGADDLCVDDRRCSRLRARESDWGPNGATRLEAVVADRRVDLELPDQSTAVRLLRGHGLRRRQRTVVAGAEGRLRFPSFHGSVRRLLCRGDGDDELVVVTVPHSSDESGGRAKRRRFPGPVLAASLVGQRTIALVAMEDRIRVVVIGKHLGQVDTIDVSAGDLGLDHASIDSICEHSLEPLFFSAGSIVVRLSGRWWSIAPGDNVVSWNYVAGAASAVSDQPRLVRRTGHTGIVVDGHDIARSSPDAAVMLGPHTTVAIETEPGEWTFNGGITQTVRVDPDATVCGLTWVKEEPAILVLSSGGHLLRLIRPSGTTTLTKLSTDVATVAVHPTLSLAAIQRTDGTIDVVDLESAAILRRIQGQES